MGRFITISMMAMMVGCGGAVDPVTTVAAEAELRKAGDLVLTSADTALQSELDDETAARKLGDAETLMAAKLYCDGATTAAVQAESAQRAQGDADTIASAKAYVDALRSSLSSTVVVVKATNAVLGKMVEGYTTAAKVGGVDVSIDWVTSFVIVWTLPGCATGGGMAFIERGTGLPSVLRDDSRYISSRGTLLAVDSDRGMFDEQSYENTDGTCWSSMQPGLLGYAITETTPAGGKTDDGIVITRYKPKELRRSRVSLIP